MAGERLEKTHLVSRYTLLSGGGQREKARKNGAETRIFRNRNFAPCSLRRPPYTYRSSVRND